MRRSALRRLTALGALGIALLPVSTAAQAPTPPAGQPGTPPPAAGAPPPPPAPVKAPSMTLTAPPRTGANPGLTPTTLQQLPREYLPAPDGIRPFPRPTE